VNGGIAHVLDTLDLQLDCIAIMPPGGTATRACGARDGLLCAIWLLVPIIGACTGPSPKTDAGPDAIVGSGSVGGGEKGGPGGSSGSGAAQGGHGANCTEIVVTTSLTDQPAWGFYPVRGGVWRTDGALNIAWKAEVADGSSGKLWLYVASYDPGSGMRTKLRRYDVFPPGVTFALGDIQAISGSDSDVFVASLRSWDTTNQPRQQTLFIGRLDDDIAQTQVDLGWKSGVYDVTDIGWDGEAFAVHVRYNGVGDVLVTRVSKSGAVTLPPTKYGVTPSAGKDYRLATNPVSGMSYLFDAPAGNRFVSAHDRRGAPVPWALNGPLDVTIPGFADAGDTAARPGVDVDSAGGAWIAWMKYSAGGETLRATAHVLVSGDVDRFFSLSRSSGLISPAVGAISPSHVWIADTDGRSLMVGEYQDGTVTPLRDILIAPPATDAGRVWVPGNFSAVDWKDERWFAFTETSDLLHVVKLAEGCSYQSSIPLAAN